MFAGYKVIDVHGHMMSPPQFRTYAYGVIANRVSGKARLQMGDSDLQDVVDHHL